MAAHVAFWRARRRPWTLLHAFTVEGRQLRPVQRADSGEFDLVVRTGGPLRVPVAPLARPLRESRAALPRCGLPHVGPGHVPREMADDSPARGHHARGDLEEHVSELADGGASSPGSSESPSQLLEEHEGSRSHQHPKLVRDKRAATRAIDRQVVLEFLDAVLGIARECAMNGVFG
jgi:hypothetical protein